MDSKDVLGKLIAVEGLDGAGSTTQTKNIVQWLKDPKKRRGRIYQTIASKEPTDDGSAGALIRMALTKRFDIDRRTLTLLYLADRLDHHARRPNGLYNLLSEQRSAVVCDRYYLSSMAYQGLEFDLDWLFSIHSNCIRPWITFFIDVPPEICVKRIALTRGLHFELFETVNQLKEVRIRYLEAINYLRYKGHNIQVINGQDSEVVVTKRIQERFMWAEESEDSGISISDTLNFDLLESTDLLKFVLINFVKKLHNSVLQLVLARKMSNGYQVGVCDSENTILKINFYNNGYTRLENHTYFDSIIQNILYELTFEYPGLKLKQYGQLFNRFQQQLPFND